VNIKNTSVVEALKCPLFQLYQENQPFNENHLRPCPIIDNPQKLEEIVEKAGAYSTQINKISAPSLCRPLYGYAEEWGEIADKVMQEEQI